MNIKIKKCGICLNISHECELDAPELVKIYIEKGYKSMQKFFEENNIIRLDEIKREETKDNYHSICLYPNCQNFDEESLNLNKCLEEHPKYVKTSWMTTILLSCHYISENHKKYKDMCRRALKDGHKFVVVP